MATNPTNIGTITNEITVIPTTWGQGINDWVWAAYQGILNLTGGRIKFPASWVSSADANTLDDYDEYTAASAACTGAITTAAVWKLTKVGNKVTLVLPQVLGAGTADSNFTFGTAIPAKYRPSANLAVACACITNNGATTTDNAVVYIAAATGIIQLYRDSSFNTFFTANVSATSTGLTFDTSVSWTI